MNRSAALLLLAWASSRVLATDHVVINEIHSVPDDKTVPEEFVELVNAGQAEVDLSGWSLTGGVRFTIPVGTTLPVGGYLVVAQDVSTVEQEYAAPNVIGPFEGRISNEGEEIVLRNAAGFREDAVDFRRGFPWPTTGGGFSMELLDPGLDNNLGGSWRISNPSLGELNTLVASGGLWRYRKGTSEASDPRGEWRTIEFDDGTWGSGRSPIGFGEDFIVTDLDDMRGEYSSVYLRRTFNVADPAEVGGLILEAQYDDGFAAWINGALVARASVTPTDPAYNDTADNTRENREFIEFSLPNPAGYLVPGDNVLAVQFFNVSLAGSSDAFFDGRLLQSEGAGAGPTPGGINSVASDAIPPLLRQVDHEPKEPASGVPVAVSIKATDPDGIGAVTLEYQTVDPGDYIPLDDPRYETSWTELPMVDDGTGLDAAPADDVFTATIPAAIQQHRRFVRYRIRAVDGVGDAVTVPYPDDLQPNFAYFVYDGVPSWRGASRPGSTPVQTFSEELMRSLPVYHLIADAADVTRSQYNSGSDGVHFLGTLVYDGVVYDHIEFENRGEFSTYVSGKNKWRIHFNRGHEFEARDNYGRKYDASWRRMNWNACASPWVPTNRGMGGLDEAVAFRSYGLAGVPSPNTGFFHLRIIDEAVEAHASDQYRGDLWGLYLTVEIPDGAFLDERNLPDGNTYKIEGGNGDKKNQGPTQVTTSSDYSALKNGYNRNQSIAWWRSNVNLLGYYSFRATNRAVNNMDLREGWNIFQYHSPEPDNWTVIPWDLDMLYMPVTHWSGIMNFQNCLSQHVTFRIEYANRARELQDLLFADGQFGIVVDELLERVTPPGAELSFADVDEAMWNYHPRTSGGHRGAFYRNPSTHSARGGTITRTLVSADHRGMAEWIKDFALEGYGANQLRSHARDGAIPDRPTVVALGAPSFPLDDLRFRASEFDDPQGPDTFGGMKWRVGEVTIPGTPEFDPLKRRRYEIDAVWESEESDVFVSDVTIPIDALEIGTRYRIRVRMKDENERWSQWSESVEFVPTAPSTAPAAVESLRITELMYHPLEGIDHEFVEVRNIGPTFVDLGEVSLSDGVEFDFADGEIDGLGPGEYVVVVENRQVFESVYDTSEISIAGEYSGRLSNGGERLRLTYGQNLTILEFEYSDLWYGATDGGGPSLHIVDDGVDTSAWADPDSWNESADPGGSPGRDDDGAAPGGRRLPSDSNVDGRLDISDGLSLLRRLFGGAGAAMPCDGDIASAGNVALLDANASGGVNVSDVIFVLNYIFLEGPPPALGTRCVRIEGCASDCGG